MKNTISYIASHNHSNTVIDLEKSYLGYSRNDCTQLLATNDIDSFAFGHWLAIPSLQLLLIFRHQHCVAVDYYHSVA